MSDKIGLDIARALIRHVAGDNADAFEAWLRKAAAGVLTGEIAVLSGRSSAGKSLVVDLLAASLKDVVVRAGRKDRSGLHGKLVIVDGVDLNWNACEHAKQKAKTSNVLICTNVPKHFGIGQRLMVVYRQDDPLPMSLALGLAAHEAGEDVPALFRAWLRSEV